MSMHPNFDRDKFLMHQKHFTIGEKYYVYDEAMQPLFYVEREKFKLRSNIHVYDGDAKNNELLTIHDKAILDFNATFEVRDSSTQELIGSLKRKGFSSILRRKWLIRDNLGQNMGQVYEDSAFKAFVRRFVPFGKIVKTDFVIEKGGREVGKFIRKLSIQDRYVLDMTLDNPRTLDRRMAIAIGILLDSAEKR